MIGINAFTFSENKGRLLENTVFLELKRQGHEVYYHKENHECDFVIRQAHRITQAIQVCYALDDDNQQREIEGLRDALQTYDLREGCLLTFDQEDRLTINDKTIHIRPVWKWLLER
ncbi:MAG: DUF4143 domain-containing protein [Bacteroidales bacterium]|nr:DUF4143 domain-containing protein [Bacteroidales bacterium]MCF8338040.1 DUF4143 domain-containing protein [Bacteroidales bacterium]